MPVPGTQEIRRPLLEALKGDSPKDFNIDELVRVIGERVGQKVDAMSVRRRNELKENLTEALAYLMAEHLISNPSRHAYMVTPKGTEVLEGTTGIIDDIAAGDVAGALQESEGLLESEKSTLGADADVAPEDSTSKIDADVGQGDSTPELDADVAHEDSLQGLDADVAGEDSTQELDADSVAEDATQELDADVMQEDSTPELDADVAQGDSQQELDADNEQGDSTPGLDADVVGEDSLPELDADVVGEDSLPELDADVMHEDSQQGLDADSELEDSTQGLDADVAQEDATQELDADSELEDSTQESDADVAQGDSQPGLDADVAQGDSTQELDADVAQGDSPQELDADVAQGDSPQELDADVAQEDATQELDADNEQGDSTQELDAVPEPEDSTRKLDAVPASKDFTQESDTDSETDSSPDDEFAPSVSHTLDYIDEVDPNMPTDEITQDYSIQPLNIEDVLERHNSELADKILMRAASLPPDTFPTFVADLLSKMGYNVFQNARYTYDASGNSLIQGVILDPKSQTPIYIHAEKLSPGRTVGKSDMRDFADELSEMGGSGIFATTGDFSEQAEICAQDERIMLIDGHKLATLMINHNFCVNVEKVFEVKELDEDSFTDYNN